MKKYLWRIACFVVIVVVQVLILNHVHIMGYATPFLVVYFLLKLDSSLTRIELLTWAFALGLAVDLCSNTWGMHAASATLVGFLRPSILRFVTIKDTPDEFSPGLSSMTFLPFLHYALICVGLYCTVLLCLDRFSIMQWADLLLHIVSDTGITLLCIFCIEAMRRS